MLSLELIQDMTFETDSRRVFVQMLRAAIRITGCSVVEVVAEGESLNTAQHPSLPAAEVWSLEVEGPRRPPIHQLVCRIRPEEYVTHLPVRNVRMSRPEVDAILTAVFGLLTKSRRREFPQVCRRPFADFDGNIGTGYRLHTDVLFPYLEVTFCNIFYTK